MNTLSRIASVLIMMVTNVIMLTCNCYAQSVEFKSSLEKLSLRGDERFESYTAELGASVNKLNTIHGITYKISFDPDVIYADSINVFANSNQLGLSKEEYYEMNRVDDSFIMYSLTLKGRNKSLNLDKLPILMNFVIKPETHYKLIANNCQFTIEFKAESVTAYDNNKTEIELSPFVLPIQLECEDKGEPNLLLAAPNPTRERCWIQIQPEKTETIKLMFLCDTNGKQFKIKPKLLGDQIEVNLSQLSSGHYYFNIVYTNQEKDVVKIVKL